ncbi:hypothetical protein BN77_p2170026 [Rhizobium mesoamericanum STM3625]|uniref:Uncharacterized protein n=1 Tax=Rhizobium mesoamericanum STM3625 TaxID=1211777 RepID=K0Q165_9HYPH|nr:hypothetical protein BN77_p2170026 [Rhizobium mesoamericanum STM3625]
MIGAKTRHIERLIEAPSGAAIHDVQVDGLTLALVGEQRWAAHIACLNGCPRTSTCTS